MPMPKIKFIPLSVNKKTGMISQSYTDSSSCPIDCKFKGNGCYASYGHVHTHWSKMAGAVEPHELKEKVKELSTHIIRHNIAGDIAKEGTNDIDKELVDTLIEAYEGKLAYTYTHCAKTVRNFNIAKKAIKKGFIISFSCETIEDVEAVRDAGLPAVMAVASMTAPVVQINGINYRKCPADGKDIFCSNCKLCTQAYRQEVVCFPAHGSGKAKARKFLIDLM